MIASVGNDDIKVKWTRKRGVHIFVMFKDRVKWLEGVDRLQVPYLSISWLIHRDSNMNWKTMYVSLAISMDNSSGR